MEWTRGVVVWRLWESDGAGNRSLTPRGGDEDEPVCAGPVGACIAYDDPSDIEGSVANLLAEQLAIYNSPNSSELAVLGIADIPNVDAGWTLIHHRCSATGDLDASFDGQQYSASGPSALNSSSAGD